MIAKIQGEGYADYDIDTYIEKLSKMTKRKLKIYQYLDEKVEQFMKVLKEEDEIRKNVKNPELLWSFYSYNVIMTVQGKNKDLLFVAFILSSVYCLSLEEYKELEQ